MIALAVSYGGMIILLIILLTEDLGIMITHLVAVLGQQSVLDTPSPSMGHTNPVVSQEHHAQNQGPP